MKLRASTAHEASNQVYRGVPISCAFLHGRYTRAMTSLTTNLVTVPIAVLSDIHGNLRALEAVLMELKRRDISRVVVAGDLLFGGDEPLAVWRRLNELHADLVRGMTDTALSVLAPEKIVPKTPEEEARRDRFLQTRKDVGELVLKQIAKLPEQRRFPLADGRELLVCHGSPRDASIDLSHDMDDQEIEVMLGGDPADIICSGGSHVCFDRTLDEQRVLGLGSVGQSPEGNVAHFVILSPRLEGTLIERGYIEY